MTVFVDVKVIEGLGLPYEPGAEAGLLDEDLDPLFHDAWEGLVAEFPDASLFPLFDELPVDQMTDLVDAIRLTGEEPPSPFLWFTIPCDEATVDAMVVALQALPLIAFAEQRSEPALAARISYGTNLDVLRSGHLRPAPRGVDGIYTWDIPGGGGEGVGIVDIESEWFLEHDELISARVNKLSVFEVATTNDHGTPVAGILVGADNGVGAVGIVPNADLGLVTINRGPEIDFNAASAIDVAASSLTPGDVLLLEMAVTFQRPPRVVSPDVLVELELPVQEAIIRATLRGITVIEPAGNKHDKVEGIDEGIDLDAFPEFDHTRSTDSGAIVVGGAVPATLIGFWQNAFAHGSRVDCFAAGAQVRAPSKKATDAYTDDFGGTSSASAIVAGVAAAIQGMSRAASGRLLAPGDLRRLLRDRDLGTTPLNEAAAGIGFMPDLRKIARALGFLRILPVGAAHIGGDALLIVHLDEDNRLVRRHFTLLAGWGQPIPSPAPSDRFELTAAQAAVLSTDEQEPTPRLVFEAFLTGEGGIHHMFWDSLNQAGNVTAAVAPRKAVAQGRALGAVRPRPALVVVAATSPQGRLVVLSGDPRLLPAQELSDPLLLDPVGMYRRVAGPMIVSRGEGLADIVVIEDGGGLSWFTGALPPTSGTGWEKGSTNPPAVEFDPGARPALLVAGDVLLVAAVGIEGRLRVTPIDPVARTIGTPVEVDVQVTIDVLGPVALARAAGNIVALGVDTDGALRAATRLATGGDWTPLLPVPSLIAISPLGGVAAVSLDVGVMAIVVGVDGVLQSALSVDGLIWSPLLPLP